ncbi:hypothetical protein ACIHIX_35095 [Streptomyces sp. NPDC051913]|uniref:hypothetical protein n=1 Tax=Streptomyces sp. NPDC051913 TaxID=3365676 RepID=UPI0037CCCB7C
MRYRSVAAAKITGLAALVAAVTLLTGCLADTGADTSGPVPGRELTRAEERRLEQAEHLLIQRCMERKGFEYRVWPQVDADTDRAFRYRIVQDDIAWAREHGYGEQLRRAFFKMKKHHERLAAQDAPTPAQHERYTTALLGSPGTPMLTVRLPSGGTVRSPNGGCTGTARTQLYGDAEAYFEADRVATDLAAAYVPKVLRDPRYTAALKAWSGCMRKETGGSYADPDAARADVRKRAKGLSVSQAHEVEVEVAVAEATCAHRTSLRSTLTRLDREYGAPWRKRYADEITRSNRLKLAALRRADDLVPGT